MVGLFYGYNNRYKISLITISTLPCYPVFKSWGNIGKYTLMWKYDQYNILFNNYTGIKGPNKGSQMPGVICSALGT